MRKNLVLVLLVTAPEGISAGPVRSAVDPIAVGRAGGGAIATKRPPPPHREVVQPPPPPTELSQEHQLIVPDTPEPSVEGATIPNEVFNLVKSIVGVGVLSLPAGVAAFGSSPSAAIPAVGLIASIGVLCAYGFSLIGKVCAYTGATSYRSAWTESVSDRTSWIPAVSAVTKTFLACTAYSMVLADTFSTLLGTARTPTLLTITMGVLLPLCLLKDLKSLAPFSLAGVLGLVYTALAMGVRLFDGSYAMPHGNLASNVAEALQPSFGNEGFSAVLSTKSLILVCMLSTAYMAHFNAPKFYLELRDNTLGRYNQVVSWSFGISIVLMGLMTTIGFLTFGESCSGLVLNNYSSTDILMGASRFAVVVSLVFSYPLAFVGCRDGILDLLNVPDTKRTTTYLNTLTVGLLSVLTCLAATLKDVSFLLALGGATLGNALSYVYPAIMYHSIVKKQGRKEPLGVLSARSMAFMGIVFGVIGAKMAVSKV